MKLSDIAIRDPFVLNENGCFYLYGTRSDNFGQKTKGFDVYKSEDLENWTSPKEVFNSEKYNLNRNSNWAPEVHKYKNKYYMFATFEQENEMRATYSLVSDTPDGEFVPCSENPLTPKDWFSLDGTLYVSNNRTPYLVFCHEHVQILNGTICYIKLSDDLTYSIGEPILMFSGSDAKGVVNKENNRYVTDGPFLYRGKNNRLYMIWSTIINSQYCQCICYSDNNEIDGNWIQLNHLFENDGGHGMIFKGIDDNLMLTLHYPNTSSYERPIFLNVYDKGDTLTVMK